MVGTGNPLFFNFFFFYRFTNGILLRMKRKIKSESEQGNASQLASILLHFFTHFYLYPNHCYQPQPPHTQQRPPSRNGPGVPWQVTVPGPPVSPVPDNPLGPACSSCRPGAAPARHCPPLIISKGSLRIRTRLPTRRGYGGSFWWTVGVTKRLRCALLHTFISPVCFPKRNLLLIILKFWSFSYSG